MAAPVLKPYYSEIPETLHHDPTPEERAGIRAEMKLYLYVFGALMLLTLTTVGISSLNLAYSREAILAISIATIKVSLVVCFFMHLLGEKKYLFIILMLPFLHVLGMMIGIAFTDYETIEQIFQSGGAVRF